ncbi:M24 family metallopeptidase [Candidatus Bipolaricaulota bacterium]
MIRESPLIAAEFERRIETTQKLMAERGFDGLVAFSSYQERQGHVAYLTNHFISFPNVMSHAGFGHAAVVLGASQPPILVAPMGYEAKNVHGIASAKTGFNLMADLVAAIKESGLAEGKLAAVGTDVIPAEYYVGLGQALPGATIEPANDLLEAQRMIKSPAEIEALRQAAHVADVGLEAGVAAVRKGASQFDIELAARRAALDAGADFIPRVRVANGPTVTTLGWPMVRDQALNEGDLVYIDFIGWVHGYGFDNSRATVVGKPTDAQRDYLDHLVEATDWMIEVLKPGKPIEFCYTESRTRTIMPFGHGIGLDICENPWVTLGRPVTLEPGMVVSIEPIVIDHKLGGMNIEDTVLVTADGLEVLNQCPRRFW